jgi:serralysin
MPDTVPGNNSSTTFIGLGSALTGRVDTEPDQDWYRITLTAGQSYTFQLWGSGTDPLQDPHLRVYDLFGALLGEDDDGAVFHNAGTDVSSRNSELSLVAGYSGAYFISAGAHQNPFFDNVGNFTLTAAASGSYPTLTARQVADYLTGAYWVALDRVDAVDLNDGPRAFAEHIVSVNLTGLDADGQRLAKVALATWENVSNIDFVETGGGAQITFTDDSGFNASTNSTVSGTTIVSSSVDIGRPWLDTYGTSLNSYGFQTYIHEIGHAIGLGNAGPYNGSATYGTHNIYANDSWAFTVMSDFDQAESGYGAVQQLGGPLGADIIAARTLYGSPYSVALGDFDADGHNDDILWHNSSSGSLATWFLSSGVATQTTATGAASLDWQIAAVADFDGDGRSDDILWRNNDTGFVVTWFTTNGVVTQSVVTGTASLDWQIAGTGDFDGDGYGDDILWRNTDSNLVFTWSTTNGVQTATTQVGITQADFQVAGVGDLDNNGFVDDILWRSLSTGAVATWNTSGGGGGPVLGAATLDWQIAGMGDFDSDGYNDDILWHNTNSGLVVTWFTSNAGGTPQSVVTGRAPLDWQIAGVGDLDGDGRSDDILWRNVDTGAVATWFLTNGVQTQTIATGAASLDWHIA